MKQYFSVRVKICLIILFVLAVNFLFGCATARVSPPTVPAANESVTYRSELDDPDAKALLAFSESRMLGSENRWTEAIAALNRALIFDPHSDYLRLALAEAHLHQQQPEQAVKILKKLEAKTPDDVAVQQLYGDALSLQKKYSSAIDHFQRALKLDPENSSLQLRLALALSRLDRNDEAVAVLEALLTHHPDASVAQLALTRLYLANDQPDKAATTYQRLMRQQPTALQPVLEYGKLLERHDIPAAFALYHDFLKLNPRAVVVRQQLAQLYLQQNRLEDALVQLKLILHQYPENARVIGQIGLIQLERKQWSEAEKKFRWLVNNAAENRRDYYYLAQALVEQQKTEEAIAALEELSSDFASYPEAALQLAYLYQKNGQVERAVELLKKMIADGVKDQAVYYYLVAFLGDQKEYQQALKFARDGIAENPESTRLLYQTGVLYEKLAQRQKARETMEMVLQVDENHADALNFLAYDQAENNTDLDVALQRAKKALKINPSGYIVDTLGWVYFKLKRYAESRIQLEKAVKMHPTDPVIGEHLGDLYRAMKLWDKAAATYRRVLEFNPQAQQVEEKLNKVMEEMS